MPCYFFSHLLSPSVCTPFQFNSRYFFCLVSVGYEMRNMMIDIGILNGAAQPDLKNSLLLSGNALPDLLVGGGFCLSYS